MSVCIRKPEYTVSSLCASPAIHGSTTGSLSNGPQHACLHGSVSSGPAYSSMAAQPWSAAHKQSLVVVSSGRTPKAMSSVANAKPIFFFVVFPSFDVFLPCHPYGIHLVGLPKPC